MVRAAALLAASFIAPAHIGGYSMGGGITGQLLATNPERFIAAHFGGSGISETDPDWIAKLPPDKQGRDPQEDAVSKGCAYITPWIME